jgi:hypothetical protein
MKTGISLTELAQTIDHQSKTKRDYLADSRKCYMTPDTNRLEIDLTQAGADVQRVEDFEVKPHAHKQLATWAGIPSKYYDRMPPDLRSVNVNHWLKNEPGQRMVRTLDGNVRAFMSDSYRPLDNIDLAQAVLPVLMEQPDMRVESCQLTETRMYIKALFPKIESDLDPAIGDIVQAGLTIQNSEVGAGALSVDPFAFRLWCLNGCVTNVGQKRRHVGKRQGEIDTAEEFYRDETKAKDDEAFWMKVQDTVRASITEEGFEKIAQRMRDTKQQQLGNPIEVVEIAAKRFGLNESEQSGILQHLVTGGDLTGFGLLNAVTRHSQDVEDYDRASDLERLGGTIIELPQSAWKEYAPAEAASVAGVAA